MTTYEARLVAKELHRLIKTDIRKYIEEAVASSLDKPMDLKEAAEYLKVKEQTIYNQIAYIPHHKVGSRLRFTKQGLDQYLLHKLKW